MGVTVSGYGSTTTDGETSATHLMSVEVPTKNCGYNPTYQMHYACAGGNSKDSCQGDSGGPLAYKSDGVWTLYGVVSHGTSDFCATDSQPGKYTRVTQYLGWIHAQTGVKMLQSNGELAPLSNCREDSTVLGWTDKTATTTASTTQTTPGTTTQATTGITTQTTTGTTTQASTIAPGSFANSPVRSDNTIRPYYDQTKCLYHKMNGFTENEKIYVSDCHDHDRFRWDYDQATGLITNWNRKWIVAHCIEIPDHQNARKKQQLFLAPCDANNPAQSWIVQNGMLRIRQTPEICAMWNLADKTRLWGLPCGEHLFAPQM